MKDKSEKAITAEIRKYLKSRDDVWFFKVHGGPMQQAGVPDILVCKAGRFYAFEVKTRTGKTTVLQDRTILLINEAGGVAEVVRSVGDVQRILE